jgi:hypothetical protein
MGRKQFIAAVGVQWIDDEHMRGCRIAFGGWIINAFGAEMEFFQRIGEPIGVAADFRTTAVGLVFAATADRQLHQGRGERR